MPGLCSKRCNDNGIIRFQLDCMNTLIYFGYFFVYLLEDTLKRDPTLSKKISSSYMFHTLIKQMPFVIRISCLSFMHFRQRKKVEKSVTYGRFWSAKHLNLCPDTHFAPIFLREQSWILEMSKISMHAKVPFC